MHVYKKPENALRYYMIIVVDVDIFVVDVFLFADF